MTWLLLSIFGWTCALIGFMFGAILGANGRTAEDDREQAEWLHDQYGADW